MNKLAGIIVTYNRKLELLKNINRLFLQTIRLDRIYIIDNNSSDNTLAFLIEKNISISLFIGDVKENVVVYHQATLENNITGINDNSNATELYYLMLNDNIGGAGGFHEGMKRAYEDGYDLIVLMDDDGRPVCANCMELLRNKALELYKYNKKIMVNSLVVGSDEDIHLLNTKSELKLSFGLGNAITTTEALSLAEEGLIKDLINPFNGTLVTRELLASIGFVNRDFFIRGDEVDFQSRAENDGALIATVVDSIYYHPASELFNVKWLGKNVSVGISPPWKTYYLIRNYTHRIKRDKGLFQALKYFIFFTYCIRKIDPEWKNCIRLLFRGFQDGLSGRLGKLVQPGEK